MSNKAGIGKEINGGVSIASILSCLYCGSTAAIAGNFVEPPVFASANGVLALLMIAKPAPIPSISFSPPDAGAIIHPTGWAYEFCPLPTANANQPPAGTATVSAYVGPPLALPRADPLQIPLSNHFPTLPPIKVTPSN